MYQKTGIFNDTIILEKGYKSIKIQIKKNFLLRQNKLKFRLKIKKKNLNQIKGLKNNGNRI